MLLKNKTKKRTVFYLIFSVLIFSCKNDSEKRQTLSLKSHEPLELIVEMEFKSDEKDEITLEMKNILVDEFQSKSIKVIEKIDPTHGTDKLNAHFGEGNISNKFEIDLGKENLKIFEIVSLSFSYGDNTVFIDQNNIENYFAFSKYSTYDKATNKITTRKVDNYHFPKLYGKKLLWDQIRK